MLYYTDAPPTTLPPYNPTPSYIAPQLNDQLPSVPGHIINPSRLTVFSPGGPPVTPPGPATLNLTRVLDFYTDPPNDSSKTQLAYFDNVSLNETGGAPSLLERIFGNPEGVPAPPPAPSGGGLYQGWNVIQVPNGAIVDIIINNHDNGECLGCFFLGGGCFFARARLKNTPSHKPKTQTHTKKASTRCTSTATLCG